MHLQIGFTLVELIVIIVILGVLGVVAIPQFANLDKEASQASVDGIAGALNSASALNYAACRSKSPECQLKLKSCEGFSKDPVLSDGLDTDYSITPKTLGSTAGDTVICTLTHKPSGLTATFTGITP